MRVYFNGTPEAAAAALANGFTDLDLFVDGEIRYGVWVSDRPQPDSQLSAELFYDDLEVFEIGDGLFLVPAEVLAWYRFERCREVA